MASERPVGGAPRAGTRPAASAKPPARSTLARNQVMPTVDPFKARASLKTAAGTVSYFRLKALEEAGLCKLDKLPYSIRILLEAVLRHAGGGLVSEEDVKSLAG